MADEKTVKAEKAAEKPAEKAGGKLSSKSEKPAKAKKPSLWKRFIKYMRDTKGEFKKIVWPTLPSVVRNTLVTLAVCLVLGLLISLVDAGLSALIGLAVPAA